LTKVIAETVNAAMPTSQALIIAVCSAESEPPPRRPRRRGLPQK